MMKPTSKQTRPFQAKMFPRNGTTGQIEGGAQAPGSCDRSLETDQQTKHFTRLDHLYCHTFCPTLDRSKMICFGKTEIFLERNYKYISIFRKRNRGTESELLCHLLSYENLTNFVVSFVFRKTATQQNVWERWDCIGKERDSHLHYGIFCPTMPNLCLSMQLRMCSVVQRDAVRCSMLQCDAVCCSVMQYVAA